MGKVNRILEKCLRSWPTLKLSLRFTLQIFYTCTIIIRHYAKLKLSTLTVLVCKYSTFYRYDYNILST